MQAKGKKTTPRTKLLIVVLIICFVLIIAGRLGCGQQPPSPPTPTPVAVDLKINGQDGAVTVAYGESATLSWIATGATSCVAYGSWSGAKSLSGTETTGPVTGNSGYTIACVGPGGSASDHVSASVATPTPTATATPTATSTPTATRTHTPVPPTNTPTVTPLPAPVGINVQHPKGMVSDASRNRLFVASLSTNSVLVWDEVEQRVLTTVAVGQKPWGVGLVNNRVFIGNSASASVSVIDAATMTKMADIRLNDEHAPLQCSGAPANVAVNQKANRVYVALYGIGRVAVIDATKNELVECLETGASGTFGIAVNPKLNQLYVTNRDARNLQVFDISRKPARLVQNEEFPAGMPFVVVADATTNRVYVTEAVNAPDFNDAHWLNIYEANSSGIVLKWFKWVGNTHDGGQIMIGENNGMIYIAATADNELEVLDPVTLQVIQRVPMQDPFGLTQNPGLDRIYVGNRSLGIVIPIEDGPPPMP